MVKAELVSRVAEALSMPKKEVALIVDTVFESIAQGLRRGDKVELRGFGSFRIRYRRARPGRNPKTGARVQVAAKKVPYFKPSKDLKTTG